MHNDGSSDYVGFTVGKEQVMCMDIVLCRGMLCKGGQPVRSGYLRDWQVGSKLFDAIESKSEHTWCRQARLLLLIANLNRDSRN